MKIKEFFAHLFNENTPKISCPKCGNIHELNVNAACPRCGTKYKLSPEYIELAKKKLAARDASERRSAMILSFLGLLHSKSKNDVDSSRRNSRKLRIISYAGAIVLICAVFVGITLFMFSDKEPLYYETEMPVNQPMFYSDTDGVIHYLFPSGDGGKIGKGTLHKYTASSDGKKVFFTFTGHLSPTESYTSNTDSESFLMSLDDYSALSVIVEGKNTLPEFIAAGNCEYLYVRQTDAEDSRFGTVSVYRNSRISETVISKVRDLCVSPNGKYALVSVEDDGATKLMRYSFTKKALDNPGVKNAYPLSVDNKGEYMIYAKKSDAQNISIISEKDTSSRVEIPVFNDTDFRELIFAADRRSFVVCYSDRMTFYSCGTDTYSTMVSSYGRGFGYDIVPGRSLNILTLDAIMAITDTDNSKLLPYFFYDKDKSNIYCLDEGIQTQIFGRIMDSAVISESGSVAFVSDGKLYCGIVDINDNRMFEMGEFGGKTLVGISPDGKLISYKDGDGNLFTVEYGKTLAQQNMGIKRSVDVSVARFSYDSKKLFVISDSVSSVINLKDNTERTVAQGLIPEATVLLEDDLSAFVFAASNPGESGDSSTSLYIYRNGKSTEICNNFAKPILQDMKSRIDITPTELFIG